MSYTNSGLIAYTKLSPNHSGQRTHTIDRISPHCVVGQCSIEGLGGLFANAAYQASSNYGIGKDGRIGMFVEEKNRSWCTSSNANDQRAVTIECASDTFHPYAMTDAVYQSLIKLCTDICRRNGKKKLIWFGDKEKSLNYTPAADEMIITVHRWFAAKSCPGDWLYSRLGDLAQKVTAALGGGSGSGSGNEKKTGTQATEFTGMTAEEVIEKVGPLFTEDQIKTGVLASVSMAQFLLESGYGKSELAQNANNVFGMKESLSGNTWSGSTWDGKSVYTKQTKEQNQDGSYITITAEFRKYACIEDSIADHSAYLLGAKKGSGLRFAGLKGCADYKKAAQIIKDGGYATSLTYAQNLCSVIEKWKLTRFDATGIVPIKYATRYWSDWAQDGDVSGTTGAAKQLEGIMIDPPAGVELEVDVHMQSIGWKTYKGIVHGSNVPLGCAEGKKRLEAIRIRCVKNTTGRKLKYQVHVQTYGWMAPCNEGEMAGTTGISKRIEAIKIWFE